MPAAGPSRNQPAPTAQKPVNPILDDDLPRSHAGLGKYVVKCFLYLLGAYTRLRSVYSVIDIVSCITLDSLAIPGKESWTQFPWRTMHTVFGNHGITIHNWPEGVPWPPINVEDLDDVIYRKSEDAEVPKGRIPRTVLQLSKIDLHFLAKAIRDPDYPLHFKVYTDGLITGT